MAIYLNGGIRVHMIVSNKKCITVAIMFLILSILGCDNTPQEKINIEVFAVSACPYILDMEKEVEPFLEEMGHLVDFNIYFYGTEREPGKFSSFHGDQESTLNIIELCIIKYNKKNYDYMKIINCLNSRVNYDDFEETISRLTKIWEECTDSKTSMNNEKVHECASGEEGINLYRKSIDYIKTVPDARVPPLVKVNGRRVPSMDTLAFKIEVCKYLDNYALCKNLPECSVDSNCQDSEELRGICNLNTSKCIYKNPIKVIIVKDDKEDEWAINKDIYAFMSLLFGKLEIEYVDPNSEEGSKLIARYKLYRFPAILFDAEGIEETSLWKREELLGNMVLSDKIKDKYIWRDYKRSLMFIGNVYAEETTLK